MTATSPDRSPGSRVAATPPHPGPDAPLCPAVPNGSVAETHRILVSLVRNYIALVSGEWPAVCRRDPDFSVETAHNYGLGLIRMLAEFQVASGIDDRVSVQLALELSEAKRNAERRVREPLPSTAEPKPGGPRWRRGYRRVGAASRPVSA